MNTQGTHKLFLYRLHEIWICQCENLTSSTPHRRRLSKPRALGADGGVSLGQATCWLTVWSCWVECFIILLPSKNASCSLGKAQPPLTMGTPPSPWTRPFGIAARACLVVQCSSWWRRQRKKRESSSDAWVWWAVLLCLPKKMRWCHREDVSVLVLNSRR